MSEHIRPHGRWYSINYIKYCKYVQNQWWPWVWFWQSKGDKKFSGIGYIAPVNEIKLCAKICFLFSQFREGLLKDLERKQNPKFTKTNLFNLQNCKMDGSKKKKRRVCFQVSSQCLKCFWWYHNVSTFSKCFWYSKCSNIYNI